MNALRRYGLLAGFALGTTLFASPDLSALIPELRLTDGVVLREVSLKSYARKGVMVRHAGGVAQLSYDKFPAEYRDAVLAKRPPGSDAVSTGNSNSNMSVVTSVPPLKMEKRAEARPQGAERLATVSGAIVLKGSQSQLADIEVRIYKLNEFADWDLNRRRSFGAQHTEMRERFNGRSTMGMVTVAEQAEFFGAEYESWEGVPRTPYITRTDATGAFSLSVPQQEALIVFARLKREVGNGVFAYYVWAVKLNGPSVVLNSGNTYPALKMAAQ